MTTTLDPPVSSPPPAPAPPQAAGDRTAVARLVAVLAAAAVGSVAFGVAKTVLVVLAVIVMIMLHELGHFLTAKSAGMKVTEFFVGFGPRLWSIRRGETEYGVKAIPLGGYVKIIGMSNLEEVDPADEARAYRQKGFWRRLSVAVAGSTMHFLIALVLLFSLNAFVGNPLHVRSTPVVETISKLETGQSPAEQAGLRVGDRITAYDGTTVASWEAVRAYVRVHAGQAIRLDILRSGQPLTLTVTPVDLSTVSLAPDPAATSATPAPAPTDHVGFLGVSAKSVNPTVGVLPAVGRSFADERTVFAETFKAFGSIFSPSGLKGYGQLLSGKKDLTETQKANRFLSPVGLVNVAGQTADAGLVAVLSLLVLLNVFIGVFNLVPLLPFDGGHVSIAVYEAVRSRKGKRYFADVAKMMPVAYATIALLGFIFLSSLYLDATNPIKL